MIRTILLPWLLLLASLIAPVALGALVGREASTVAPTHPAAAAFTDLR